MTDFPCVCSLAAKQCVCVCAASQVRISMALPICVSVLRRGMRLNYWLHRLHRSPWLPWPFVVFPRPPPPPPPPSSCIGLERCAFQQRPPVNAGHLTLCCHGNKGGSSGGSVNKLYKCSRDYVLFLIRLKKKNVSLSKCIACARCTVKKTRSQRHNYQSGLLIGSLKEQSHGSEITRVKCIIILNIYRKQ